jgi:prepilin signal peptidase PulO-like enzyme (type II secretory pathway)
VALAAVPERFAGFDERALFGVYFVALVLLMGTDLDQRLLPDVVTLPLIVLGLAALAWGGDSLVSRQSPVARDPRSDRWSRGSCSWHRCPFGEGAFGIGDVKLLLSVGRWLRAWPASPSRPLPGRSSAAWASCCCWWRGG